MTWHRLGRSRSCPEGIARYTVNDGITYIWCGGTIGLTEWLWNFSLPTVKHNGRRYNRRDWKQANAVADALYDALSVHELLKNDLIICGLSRGGSVAIALEAMLENRKRSIELTLFAPKRAGRKLKRYVAIHYRGDVVPFLPPWYTSYDLYVCGKRTWPWRAHEAAAKEAAKWRHRVGKP